VAVWSGLVRENGLQGAKRRGKPWRTTKADPDARRSPDLVQRDFAASRPDETWFADFTYLRCITASSARPDRSATRTTTRLLRAWSTASRPS
jgi:transposase InsO family protein